MADRWPGVSWLLLGVLLALAVVGRTATHYETIFPTADDARLLGTDAYYHLRHTRFTVDHFPSLMRRDVGTHYPSGLRDDSAGLFNIVLAASALAAHGGEPSDQQLRVLLAYSPIVIFVLTSVALFWLASAVVGNGGAILCCLGFFLFPGASLERTALGFGDYHALEMLLALGTVVGVIACLRQSRSKRPPPWWTPAFAACLPLVLFLFSWRGAPIYLPLVGFAFLLVGLHNLRHGGDWKPAASAACRYGAAVLVVAGGTAFLVPSLVLAPRFFPLSVLEVGVLSGGVAIMGIPAAVLLLANAIVQRLGSPAPRVAAAFFAVASCAAVGLAFLLVAPAENTLVSEASPVSLGLVWQVLGPTPFLAVIAAPVVLLEAWRRSDAWPSLVVLPFFGGLGFLWIRTNDFGYLVPAFAALLATILVVAVARWLGRRLRPRAQWVAGLAALIGLALLFSPPGGVRRPWYVHHPDMMPFHEGWAEAMRWMRNETPRPSVVPTTRVAGSGRDDFAYPNDAYGVLSTWENGNFVSAIGERLTVSSRYPTRRSARLLYSPDAPQSQAELCPDCDGSEAVRYVVVDARAVTSLYRTMARMIEQEVTVEAQELWDFEGSKRVRGVYGESYRRSLAARLYLQDGRGLGRYRLVYESPSEHVLAYRSGESGVVRTAVRVTDPSHRARAVAWIDEGSVYPSPLGLMYDPVIVPSVKIFEHVRGARITGTAPAGSRIEARLELLAQTSGRSFGYSQSTVADTQGRYALELPYATYDSSSSDVSSQGPYRVRAFQAAGPVGGVALLHLTEAQVLGGEPVRLDLGS